MAISFYDTSVGTYLQTLGGVIGFLEKGRAHCEANGIRMYGGGQFELGVGRRHIQVLASLFYPDGPNDVAPSEYNTGAPRPGLPGSPLPPPEQIGL